MDKSKNSKTIPESLVASVSGSVTSSELRLGNLVYLPSKAIYAVDVLYKNYEMLGTWKPIPITEEWLSDFGFTQTNESEDVEWYKLNGFEIAIHEEDGEVYFVYQHMVLRHIIHVHQLQNLYFAITGTELAYENETK